MGEVVNISKGRLGTLRVYASWRPSAYVMTPILWRWSLAVHVWTLPHGPLLFGITVGRHEDDDGVFVTLGLGLVDVMLRPVRWLTRREIQRRRQDLVVREAERAMGRDV